jgi:hypothetical protein
VESFRGEQNGRNLLKERKLHKMKMKVERRKMIK